MQYVIIDFAQNILGCDLNLFCGNIMSAYYLHNLLIVLKPLYVL